ncbi:hypothetical protein EYR40_002204 [Pleurotus pulmonarius]|nr:hypothetical protein EYR40_002204 [Pleurotus pulmonarius]
MVSSTPISASPDKEDSLSVLVASNISLSDSVAALTQQVVSLSLTVASLAHGTGHHEVTTSPSATLVASAAPAEGDDDDHDDHLSYISEPDDNYSNFTSIQASTTQAITSPPVTTGMPAAAGTVGAPGGGDPGAPATAVYHAPDIDPSLRWYLVTVGRRVGVIQGWENVAPLVLGIRGAVFNRQPSQQVGLQRFHEARSNNNFVFSFLVHYATDINMLLALNVFSYRAREYSVFSVANLPLPRPGSSRTHHDRRELAIATSRIITSPLLDWYRELAASANQQVQSDARGTPGSILSINFRSPAPRPSDSLPHSLYLFMPLRDAKPGRKVSLSSYYERHQESLRGKARARMAAARARKAALQTIEERAADKANTRAIQGKYRERNRDALRHKESLCRERKKLADLGFFDSPENDDNYSEYEEASDSDSCASSSGEEDWDAEAQVYRDLRARAEEESTRSFYAQLLKRRSSELFHSLPQLDLAIMVYNGSSQQSRASKIPNVQYHVSRCDARTMRQFGIKLNVRTHQFHSRSGGSLSSSSSTLRTTFERAPSPEDNRFDFTEGFPSVHALLDGQQFNGPFARNDLHLPAIGNTFTLDPAYVAHLAELDTDEVAAAPRSKKPSDQPLMVFLEVLDTYLHEMMRHEGLGDNTSPGMCTNCRTETVTRLATPNPFASAVKTMSQHAVRLELNEEEALLLAQGKLELFHEDVTPCVLISTGLDLEEQQRTLARDISGLGLHATDRQRLNIIQRANALRNKLNMWLDHQKLYCPAAFVLHSGENSNSQSADPVAAVPTMNLWLPSSLGPCTTCPTNLREIEWKLRFAQAQDALNHIRASLQIRAGVFQQKDRFERGQRAMTRSRSVIARLQDKIDDCAERYRVARRALAALAPILNKSHESWATSLQELRDGDIRAISAGEIRETEGRRTMSWIWRVEGVAETAGQNETIHDSLRVECAPRDRAYARQHVKLSGLGAPSFKQSIQQLQELTGQFGRFFEPGSWAGWAPPKTDDGFLALEANCRYFTPIRYSEDTRDIPFERTVDPQRHLERSKDSRLIHTADNVVEFYQRLAGGAGYAILDPKEFRDGDIVAAHVSFLVVASLQPNGHLKGSRDAHQHRMLVILRGLTLLERNAHMTTLDAEASPNILKISNRARTRKRIHDTSKRGEPMEGIEGNDVARIFKQLKMNEEPVEE